ncbi:uncharacterized protein LOC135094239 isoform X1 [Scylla paramamosain]|uniref:uncharacterized protein LOC135094239 isoform X1 n=1 Tax=Scylla paramamosain TaxID=85552 RepID=UPI0030827F75
MGLLPPQDTRSIAEALRKTSQPLTQRTQLCTEAGTGFSQHLAWSLQQKEATPASSTTTIYPPLSLPAMLTLSHYYHHHHHHHTRHDEAKQGFRCSALPQRSSPSPCL